jgi:uncharacterized protein YunC (DUF1805 family)
METVEVSRAFIKGGETSKVERYKWKAKDQPGRHMRIPKERLKVDDTYQRDFKEAKVSAIRAEWSYIACGAISVARREDGSFWVMDGQHRVLAAMARADVSHIDCMVFESTSVKEEARGFLASNTVRKPLTSIDKFKAQIVAGNTIAIEAQKLLTQAGYVASKNEKAKGVRSISSILHCLKVDAETFKTVWPAIVASAQGQAIMERTIYGLFWIEKHRVNDSLSDPKWLKRLAQVGQEELLTAAAKASAYYARGGAQVWGPGMLLVINKRMQEKFKVDKSE